MFAGVDGNSEGLVVKFDEGKVIGISSCWNISFCFYKRNKLDFFPHTVIQNKNEAAVWFLGQEFYLSTKKNQPADLEEKCLQGWL